MEAKKWGDILAFKKPGQKPMAFHARNLEVAEISLELWQELSQAENLQSEALEALKNWNRFESPDVKMDPWNQDQGLKAITINVTQVCNLACKYCAAGGNGSYGDPVKRIQVEKTLPQLKTLMDRATHGGKFQITFLGGEPLLYPEGIRILAEVARELAAERELHLDFIVVTNGTQFTSANIELLCELGAHITVSVDGPAEINDQRRPTQAGRGVTSQVVSGLEALMAAKSKGLGRVGLSGVFGKGNLELMAAYEFYRSFKPDWLDFTFDHFEANAHISASFVKALNEVAARAYAEGGESQLRQIKLFDHYFSHLDHQERIENHCGAGKDFLMVDARNQVTTCPWLVGEAKEVVGVGSQIWENRLESFSQSLVEQNGCGGCWARYLCGGGCMYVHRNKTGDKHAVDIEFCERTKRILLTAFEYYLEARSVDSSQLTTNTIEGQG